MWGGQNLYKWQQSKLTYRLSFLINSPANIKDKLLFTSVTTLGFFSGVKRGMPVWIWWMWLWGPVLPTPCPTFRQWMSTLAKFRLKIWWMAVSGYSDCTMCWTNPRRGPDCLLWELIITVMHDSKKRTSVSIPSPDLHTVYVFTGKIKTEDSTDGCDREHQEEDVTIT